MNSPTSSTYSLSSIHPDHQSMSLLPQKTQQQEEEEEEEADEEEEEYKDEDEVEFSHGPIVLHHNHIHTHNHNTHRRQGLLQLSSRRTRWLILVLNCVAMTGSYYSYDIPAALHQQLTELLSTSTNNTNYDDAEVKFNLLYTVYSLPNVLLPLFGGNIVDRLGAAKCMVLFAGILLLGQVIFAFGSLPCSSNHSSSNSENGIHWPLMLLGRTIYGMGGENLTVSSSALLARWFAGAADGGGGEMALAFAVTLALSRLGSVANNWASPMVANHVGEAAAEGVGVGHAAFSSSSLSSPSASSSVKSTSTLQGNWWSTETTSGTSAALFLGVLVNLVVLLAACAAYMVDQKADQEEKHRPAALAESLLLQDENENDDDDEEEYILMNNGRNTITTITTTAPPPERGGMLLPMTQVTTPPTPTHPSTTPLQDQDGGSTSIQCSDIPHFGPLFWLLTCSCLVVYGCVLPFNNIASGILLERDYFVSPSTTTTSSCQLVHPNQCTEGTLVTVKNPSLDVRTGQVCPGNPHVAPILPTSLHVWYEGRVYEYEGLRKEDVQCDLSTRSTSSSSGSSSSGSSTSHDHTTTTNSNSNNSYSNNNTTNTNNTNPYNTRFWSEACTANYCRALHAATETAAKTMSIPYVLSAALSIPLGYMVDTFGHRATGATLAPVLLVLAHLLLGFFPGLGSGEGEGEGGGVEGGSWRSGVPMVPPEIPLVLQGVAYTLYASVIWPSVPLTLSPPHSYSHSHSHSHSQSHRQTTGTAYGVITSAQNLCLAGFPLMLAWIYESAGQRYLPWVEVFFVGLAGLGVGFGVCLGVVDGRLGGRLNGTCRRNSSSRNRRRCHVRGEEGGTCSTCCCWWWRRRRKRRRGISCNTASWSRWWWWWPCQKYPLQQREERGGLYEGLLLLPGEDLDHESVISHLAAQGDYI